MSHMNMTVYAILSATALLALPCLCKARSIAFPSFRPSIIEDDLAYLTHTDKAGTIIVRYDLSKSNVGLDLPPFYVPVVMRVGSSCDLPPFYVPVVMRVGSSCSIGCWAGGPATDAANSAGVTYPNDECGRW